MMRSADGAWSGAVHIVALKGGSMAITPLAAVVGSGIPSLTIGAGPAGTALGASGLGLLVLTALLLALVDRRSRP